jgi:hypothetical protein
MASQDFIELMKKLHDEKYKIYSKKIEYDGMGEHPSLKVTVVLEKDGNQISIQSSEPDFLKYVVELRGVADTTGEHKFTRVKDLDQYNADVEHLIDIDKSKLSNAVDDLKSGKFKFTYDPPGLVNEFLKSERNVKNKKFLPLKRDYHHILASVLLASRAMQKAYKRLENKYSQAKKVFKGIDSIMRGFWLTGNPTKDYNLYRNYLTFDISELGQRMSTQLPLVGDTAKDFKRRGGVDANIGIPRLMNIYGRFLELLKPMLNIIRIGLELRRGNLAPDKNYPLTKNIEVLKSDWEYGQLFDCLDEQIRHSDAHVAVRIDKADRKIYLMDTRSAKERIVKVYTFDEFTNMLNVMNNQFFPVIYSTIALFDAAMLDLVLVSKEYKFLLLALDNC